MSQCIVYEGLDGRACIVIPAPECLLTIEQIAAKDVPQGFVWRIVPTTEIPSDRFFRNAWKGDLTIDLPKAKILCHQLRRSFRDAEMAPLDAIIARQIPGEDAVAAETARAALRTKYATLQTQINGASTPLGLRALLAAARP